MKHCFPCATLINVVTVLFKEKTYKQNGFRYIKMSPFIIFNWQYALLLCI